MDVKNLEPYSIVGFDGKFSFQLFNIIKFIFLFQQKIFYLERTSIVLFIPTLQPNT